MNTPANIEDRTPEVAGRAGELLEMASRCEIKTDKDLENASDLTKFIKAAIKKADEERTSITKPIKDSIKLLESKFKAITDPLEAAEKSLKGKILAFEQERRRKAEEEARQIAQEEAERKALEKLAEAGGSIFDEPTPEQVAEVQKEVAPAPVVTAPVRGNYGSTSSIVKRWTFKVVDIKALAAARPDLVMVISGEINAAIRQGERNIPGLDIYQEETVSVR